MRIFAHRGVSSRAPENTMAAFVKCLDVGVQWFEFDVDSLKDSSLVVMHDDTVDRTTNGRGRLADLTFDQVRRLDAGSWFGPTHRLERVPELPSVIALLNDTSLCANLEMKRQSIEPDAFVSTVAEVVSGLRDPAKLLVSSFVPELLSSFAKLCPGFERGYLVDRGVWQADLIGQIKVAEELGAVALHPEAKGLDAAAVEAIHRAGLRVNAWTVNDVAEARRLRECGVDGLFTDDPAALIAAGLQD